MTSGQVTRSQKLVQSKVQISTIYLYTRPTLSFGPIPVNFSGCASLTELYSKSFVFYVADLRSSEGHDFVMLILWENIQITPIPKILEISASFRHLCASLPHYVTIRDSVCLCWVYLSKRGVK